MLGREESLQIEGLQRRPSVSVSESSVSVYGREGAVGIPPGGPHPNLSDEGLPAPIPVSAKLKAVASKVFADPKPTSFATVGVARPRAPGIGIRGWVGVAVAVFAVVAYFFGGMLQRQHAAHVKDIEQSLLTTKRWVGKFCDDAEAYTLYTQRDAEIKSQGDAQEKTHAQKCQEDRQKLNVDVNDMATKKDMEEIAKMFGNALMDSPVGRLVVLYQQLMDQLKQPMVIGMFATMFITGISALCEGFLRRAHAFRTQQVVGGGVLGV
jgi:hypothetical protein